MARIYDVCSTQGFIPPWGLLANEEELVHWHKALGPISASLRKSEIIVADNVAKYFYEGTDQENWDDLKDFPCVAPPFETMWVEWKMPPRSVSREHGVKLMDPDFLGVAVLLVSETFESGVNRYENMSETSRSERLQEQVRRAGLLADQAPPGRMEQLARLVNEALTKGQNGLDILMDTLIPSEKFMVATAIMQKRHEQGKDYLPSKMDTNSECGWIMHCRAFIHRRNRGVVGPALDCTWSIAKTGAILDKPILGAPGTANPEAVTNSYSMCFPALLALSFMNCKNVRRLSNVPDLPLSRKHEKKAGAPLCRYWTLDIEPMREVLQREGKSGEVGVKKALHICRGHFAVYDEKPLFGRYQGRFWKPAHARGLIQKGVVTKDYAIHSPKN